jgi:hypothetical protein
MARTPTASQLRFVDQRTRALVRSQRPFLAQFVGYTPPPPPPVNTAAPVVSGTPTVGSTLNTTNGTWTGGPTFTYRWLRNNVNITLNAQGQNYTLVAADAGTNVSCRVTGTNAGGVVNAVSNALAIT